VARSGYLTIGLIVASILIGGRPRLIILKNNGEVWPISTHDVQFVMPASLVPSDVAEACWSSDLLGSWQNGEGLTNLIEESPEAAEKGAAMQNARRKAVMTLRRIMRETERMCGRMMGGVLSTGRVGGVEAVWERFAPENENEPGAITAADAAEYILNVENLENPTTVRPNTLPAYAAHVFMMRRSDLFLGDQGDMWASGAFYVRSRAERRRLNEVQRVLESETEEDVRILAQFVEKAKAAVEVSRRIRADASSSDLSEQEHSLPEWTSTERNLLAVLLAPLYETRSTQISSILPLATAILKAIDPYPDEVVDRDLFIRLLQEVGSVRPWESLRLSEAKEAEIRTMAMAGAQKRGPEELLQGNELDELREDFTSHRVFVVDDATASELDDGMSVERIHGSDEFWVHVHIADPTRYLPPSHPLAVQASFRGSSMYLAEGNRPLLPLDVTMKELSLGADVSREDAAQGVMTFSSRMGLDGVVKDSKACIGWIKKPRVITYLAVNEALGIEQGVPSRPFGSPIGQEPKRPNESLDLSDEDLADLRLLRDVAGACRSQRFATAGLESILPELSLQVLSKLPPSPDNLFDPANLPLRPELYAGSPIIDYLVSPPFSPGLAATLIVQELMILAGRTAAAFCHSRNIPVPYRSSPPPKVTATPGRAALTIEDLLAMRDPDTNLTSFFEIMKGNFYFTSGDLSLEPKPHWVMGFDKPDSGYVRATSPLRRFDDLLVHWQIKAALAKEKGLSSFAPIIPASDVQTLAQRSDQAQRRVRRAGKTAQAFWQAGLFASRFNGPVNPDETVDLREPLNGRISAQTFFGSGTTPDSTPVFIPSLGTVIRLGGADKLPYVVGEEVRVKIIQSFQWPNPIVNSELA